MAKNWKTWLFLFGWCSGICLISQVLFVVNADGGQVENSTEFIDQGAGVYEVPVVFETQDIVEDDSVVELNSPPYEDISKDDNSTRYGRDEEGNECVLDERYDRSILVEFVKINGKTVEIIPGDLIELEESEEIVLQGTAAERVGLRVFVDGRQYIAYTNYLGEWSVVVDTSNYKSGETIYLEIQYKVCDIVQYIETVVIIPKGTVVGHVAGVFDVELDKDVGEILVVAGVILGSVVVLTLLLRRSDYFGQLSNR